MTVDPAKRQMRCPACSQLVPLDHAGKFAAHAAPAQKRWCPWSGRSAVRDPLPHNPAHRIAVSLGHEKIEDVDEWP